MKTTFFRVLQSDDKEATLRAAINKPSEAGGPTRFEVETSGFSDVPGSPFAYWVGERVRRIFVELRALEDSGRAARQGGVNGDDFRWLRLWFETDCRSATQWVPIAKGGKFSPFYADLPLQASWDSTRGTFWGFTGLPHRPSLKPASFDFYFRPGLTWPRRTNGLSLRVLPGGCIFADKGPGIFVENNDPNELLALCGITNSKAFGLLVSLQLARTELAQSYEVGLIQQTPVPDLTSKDSDILSDLGRRAWSSKRALDSSLETSHAFLLPALLQGKGDSMATRTTSWLRHIESLREDMENIQREIDAVCLRAYGIENPDRLVAVNVAVEVGASAVTADDEDDKTEQDAEDESEDGSFADESGLAAELVSWGIGVAFGRMDVRLATGERDKPNDPDPFDPLPSCSPGMLTDSAGLPIRIVPPEYPFTIAANGLLADDPGHPLDITTSLRTVFDTIFQNSSEAWWNDVGMHLDPKNDVRAWLSTSFFEHHLKRYSKGKRKSPVFWQISVQSGRYSVWLYAHRLNRDSLLNMQNDVVAPKLAHEERQLADLIAAGNGGASKEQREIEKQQAFVEELRRLDEEVKRVAPLWKPSLDDGVVLTMAPLWRLVPRNKGWQRELKSKWDGLVAGKYDWSHLAMHLWPERVVPKCAVNRSFAIAHGLEDNFWFEDEDGKWKSYEKPKRSVDALVRERTSSAVKAALKSLLEAPDATSGVKRTRRSRAA